jgi:hypothetical protein
MMGDRYHGKGDVMATEVKAGGKRWGLRDTNSKLWHSWYAESGPDLTFHSRNGSSWASWAEAEQYRMAIKETGKSMLPPDRFEVADIYTGDVIHPEDPRLKPPAPGTVRVVKGEHAGKVGKYISTGPSGEVYCGIDGRFYGLPGDHVEVGPPVEEDDAVDDEPDTDTDTLDDSRPFAFSTDQISVIFRMLDAASHANEMGDQFEVARIVGRIEGMLGLLGVECEGCKTGED